MNQNHIGVLLKMVLPYWSILYFWSFIVLRLKATAPVFYLTLKWRWENLNSGVFIVNVGTVFFVAISLCKVISVSGRGSYRSLCKLSKTIFTLMFHVVTNVCFWCGSSNFATNSNIQIFHEGISFRKRKLSGKFSFG